MALNIVQRCDDRVAVRNVLISLYDKQGLEGLVEGLLRASPQVTIYSTGGTRRAIAQLLGAARAVRHLVAVTDYTGQPEMQGGLVKTLDFKIYLGLLSETYNPAHQADLARLQAVNLDMVVVNLYPFGAAVAGGGATPEVARTHIDIGGPCMVRAAAKNYLRVAAVTDPLDYPALLEELADNGGTLALATRFALMRKAFALTAAYDGAIAAHFAERSVSEVLGTYDLGAGTH